MQNLRSSTSASTVASLMSSSSPLTSIYGSNMSTSSDTLNNNTSNTNSISNNNNNNSSSNNNNNIVATPPSTATTDITSEGNLLAKISAHSASHSALAAAAALQSLNQSHIQRAHQQPQQYPPSSMRPPSSSSSSSILQLQQMHGNNSMPKLGVTSTTSSDHQNHNHLALSANQQQTDNNPDFNVRFQQQQKLPPGIRPPTSWQEQAAVAAAAAANMNNGAPSRWLFPNSFQNPNLVPQQTPNMFPANFPPNSVNSMSNSNIMIGQDGDSHISSNSNPTSRASSRAPLNSDRQQFSTVGGPLNLDGKNHSGSMKLQQQQTNAWIEGYKVLANPQLEGNKSLQQQLLLQPQQHQQRASDENELRLQVFIYNLYNTYIPGTNKPKKVIPLDSSEGLRQSILNGEFYSRYENIAFDILQNQVIIPEFNIIDYIRREKSSMYEIEKIESVHKRLGISSLFEPTQQIRQPPSSNSSLLMKTSDSRLPQMDHGLAGLDVRSAEHQAILDQQVYNALRNSPYYREPTGGAGPQFQASSSSINDKNRRSSQSPSDNSSSRSHNSSNNQGANNSRNLSGNLNLASATPNHANNTSYQSSGINPALGPASHIYPNPRNQTLAHTKALQGTNPASFNNPNINLPRPPPRSQSTMGPGLSCRSPPSPYYAYPPQCPPNAHQNTVKLPPQDHSKGAPLAHQSSCIPQVPKIPDNLPPKLRMTTSHHSPPGIRGFIDDKGVGRMPMPFMPNQHQTTNSSLSRSEIDSVTGLPLSTVMSLKQQELNLRGSGNMYNQSIGVNVPLINDHTRSNNSRPSSNPQMASLFSPHNQKVGANSGPPIGPRGQMGLNFNNSANSSMPPPISDHHKSMNQMDMNGLNGLKSNMSPGPNVADNEAQLKALVYQHQHLQHLQHQQNLMMANQSSLPTSSINNSSLISPALQISTAIPTSESLLMDMNRRGSLSGDNRAGSISQQPSPRQSNQRSIITGSASGCPKKGKKVKHSPPITQSATEKPCVSPLDVDRNKMPTETMDTQKMISNSKESSDSLTKQTGIASEISIASISGSEIGSVEKMNIESECGKDLHRTTFANASELTKVASDLVAPGRVAVTALEPHARDLPKHDSVNNAIDSDHCKNIVDVDNNLIGSDSTKSAALDTNLNNPATNFTSDLDNNLTLKSTAGIDNNSTSDNNNAKASVSEPTIEPQSKYQKLYTKKAWLKNYDLEDQSRSQNNEAPENIPLITKSEIKSETLDPTTTSSSKPGSPKTNSVNKSTKTLKRKKKSKETSNKSKSVVTPKQSRPTKSAENDSGAHSSSTSELDTDDEEVMSVKKLRRMPRRKVKPSPANTNNTSNNKNGQQQSSPKTKTPARENARKKIKKEPVVEEPLKEKKENLETEESDDQGNCDDAAVLQLEPCYEMVPKNIRCLECRRMRVPSTKGDKVPSNKQSGKNKLFDDFCRFYAFRKLTINKSSPPMVAGFSDLNDVTQQDKEQWLPMKSSRPVQMNFKVAKFILANVGDQFCNMTMQERAAKRLYHLHNDGDKKITWKRAVLGLRELCDVCATTLFNCHYVCEKCGFVVCIECYQSRANNLTSTHGLKAEIQDIKEEKEVDKPPSLDSSENSLKESTEQQPPVATKRSKRDTFGWIYCARNEKHVHEKLTLSQIITSDCIEEVWTMLHEIRDRLKLGTCICKRDEASTLNSECHEAGEDKPMLVSDSTTSLPRAPDGSHSTLKDLLLASGSIDPDDSSNHSTETDCNLQIHEEEEEEEDNVKSNDKEIENQQMFSDSSNLDDGPSEDMDLLKEQVTKTIDDCIAALPTENIPNLVSSPDKPIGEQNIVELKQEKSDATECKNLDMDCKTHSWLCDNELLVLSEPRQANNIRLFRKQWILGRPLVVRGVDRLMNIEMWLPQYFGKQFGDYRSDLVDCRNGDIHRHSMKKYWDGFEPSSASLKRKTKEDPFQAHTANNDELSNGPSYYSGSALWRLKDWPPGQDFFDILPEHYEDFMNNLPLKPYTTRTGFLNLAHRLPSEMLKPDLGPKMYSAYGTSKFPDRGTTNLHLDISDAINVMIYVNGATSFNKGSGEFRESYEKTVADCCVDQKMKDEILSKKLVPGALWHVFKPGDASKMRDFLNKVSEERNISPDKRTDPIHDQTWYLDQILLDRLREEYGVKPYAILQCMGDAIVIPAGAPHQVKNLQNCIKVANDFVSPENVEFCLRLTNEFRSLPETHMNQEDKLQIKNILYHSVKQCLQYIRLFESGEIGTEEIIEEDEELDME